MKNINLNKLTKDLIQSDKLHFGHGEKKKYAHLMSNWHKIENLDTGTVTMFFSYKQTLFTSPHINTSNYNWKTEKEKYDYIRTHTEIRTPIENYGCGFMIGTISLRRGFNTPMEDLCLIWESPDDDIFVTTKFNKKYLKFVTNWWKHNHKKTSVGVEWIEVARENNFIIY